MKKTNKIFEYYSSSIVDIIKTIQFWKDKKEKKIL